MAAAKPEELARLRGHISRALWDDWLTDENIRRAAKQAFVRGDLAEMRKIARRLDELQAAVVEEGTRRLGDGAPQRSADAPPKSQASEAAPAEASTLRKADRTRIPALKSFRYGILLGLVVVFAGLATAYTAIAVGWPTSLPPPAISPLISLDFKLRFLRDNPTLDPNIVAVGSSIAWRQLDGAAFRTMAAEPHRFLNGAAGNLKIHQTRDLVNFYLERYRNIRTVLVLVGPPDFDDCSVEPARLFDHDDAGAYAFRKWPAPYFYLRYFSPSRYAQAVLTLAERQTPFTGELFLDGYGSGPLQVPISMRRGLRYEAIEPDPKCVAELIALSKDLEHFHAL